MFSLFCRRSNISIDIIHYIYIYIVPLLLVSCPVYYNYLLLHIFIYTDYLIQFFSLIIDYLFIQSIGAGLCLFMFQELSVGRQYKWKWWRYVQKRGGTAWYKRSSSDENENIYLYRTNWFIETLISNNSKLFLFFCYLLFLRAQKVFVM